MRTLRDHDERRNPSWKQRIIGAGLLALLVAVGAIGCGKKAEETPPPAEPMTSASLPGSTSTINLNKGPQDSCVTFTPHTTSIRVGDRVNFSTNSAEDITVNVPAGLFSASDTTITVSRGANSDSPTARALGTYPLTSNPAACSQVTGGPGPAIIVDAGAQ